MGNSFTTAGQLSTPPAPRETWAQRMSRREHQRRESRPVNRVGPDVDRSRIGPTGRHRRDSLDQNRQGT